MSAKLQVVAADALSGDTAQSSGMQRSEAISGAMTGAGQLWMGRTVMAAGGASADHHHGESETGIYVVAGTPAFAFRDPDSGELVRLHTKPGDFVWVPPQVPHREENPADTEAVLVVARSTQEAIVVNLLGL
jgi:uncharacterized RmlC-like cupin family protein